MRFDYYTPCNALMPFVQSFVISEADEEKAYKVLPSLNVVIGFQYRGKLKVIKNGQDSSLSNYGVTGLQDSYKIFQNSAGIGSVLVYFKVTGAALFFSEPLHELYGQSLSLDNFILRSELLILEEQLCEAKTDVKRINLVEQFLVSRLKEKKVDMIVSSAVALIYQHGGNIRISEIAKKLNISESPLEKRFRRIVGASPKKFSSLVRLKQAIEQFNPQTSLTALGYATGFYDQSHFIKEFKTFTGLTPEHFFDSK